MTLLKVGMDISWNTSLLATKIFKTISVSALNLLEILERQNWKFEPIFPAQSGIWSV